MYNEELKNAQTIPAHLDLLRGFFTRDVEHRRITLLKPMQGLKHQGGFPDTGIAADQDDRSGHDAAAEHTVEFGQAGGKTELLGDGYFIDRHRGFPGSDRLPAALPNSAFLFEGIPLPTIRATSGPPWRLTATFLTNENRAWAYRLS